MANPSRQRGDDAAGKGDREQRERESKARPLLLFDDPIKAGLVGAAILVAIALLRRFAC